MNLFVIENLNLIDIDGALSKKFTINKLEEYSENFRLYDTFDFLLYLSSVSIRQAGNKIYFENQKNGEILISEKELLNKTRIIPSKIKNKKISDSVDRIVHLRILLPKLEIASDNFNYNILNRDGKIVCRLSIQNLKLKDLEIVLVETKEVKGYEKQYAKLNNFFISLKHTKQFNNKYELIYDKLNLDIKQYSSKFNVELSPKDDLHDSLIKIAKECFRIMTLNEDGIKKDFDTEFLHDFRVAIRKLRSALSIVNNVYNKDITKEFKSDISLIANQTGLMRDLDVFILGKDKLFNLIPTELANGLIPLFEHIKKLRRKEFSNLKKYLNSNEYAGIITKWYEFIEQKHKKNEFGKNAYKATGQFASRSILKKFTEIISAGKLIDENSPDEKLHELRIECKKLRYLIEFFQSVYDKNLIKSFSYQLKELQTVLGTFNDISVQRENLYGYVNSNLKFLSEDKKISASIGGVIAILQPLQNEARSKFANSFRKFSSKKNINLAKQIFGEK